MGLLRTSGAPTCPSVDAPKTPTPASQRVRKMRERRRRGQAIYQLTLTEFVVLDRLITAGLLADGAECSPAQVEAALTRFVNRALHELK